MSKFLSTSAVLFGALLQLVLTPLFAWGLLFPGEEVVSPAMAVGLPILIGSGYFCAGIVLERGSRLGPAASRLGRLLSCALLCLPIAGLAYLLFTSLGHPQAISWLWTAVLAICLAYTATLLVFCIRSRG